MPISAESIQVWVVPLAHQTADRWRRVLSPAEWAKAMRYRGEADQLRSTVTRGVLRTLLSRFLDKPTDGIEFTENEFGKPATPGIEFNVSHSGDYALMAFSKSSAVGIDVEQIKDRRVIEDLARRVLTPAEHDRFTALPESDRQRTFFDIWALKESILKGIGSGLSIAPECIEIDFPPAVPRLLSAPEGSGDWYIQNINIGHPQYAAALASRANSAHIEINHFE